MPANQARDSGPLSILTIGHSTRSADAFLGLLEVHGVTGLADIRTVPQSRRHPHFSRAALERSLQSRGIEYRHFPALGGLRKPRPDSPNSAWQNASFRGYADHMHTPGFSRAVDDLLAFAAERVVAVMCAEAVWWRCHRMLLADALVTRGVRVRHIVTESEPQDHKLTPFSRRRPAASEGEPIWYPGLV